MAGENPLLARPQATTTLLAQIVENPGILVPWNLSVVHNNNKSRRRGGFRKNNIGVFLWAWSRSSHPS